MSAPRILYYDREGNFRGVENGVDFQDDDTFLKIRWWETVYARLCKTLTTRQVEVLNLAYRAVRRDEGPDEHTAPKGKNHCRCLRRFYGLPL